MATPPEGPFVAMAVLCRGVEARPDGTVDVLGLVDGIILTPEGEEPLGSHPTGRLSLTALVGIRAGSCRGRHILGLHGVHPTGAPGPSAEREVDLSDDSPAASLVVPIDLEVSESGTYHFDVRFDGDLLTRMPLHIEFASLGG